MLEHVKLGESSLVRPIKTKSRKHKKMSNFVCYPTKRMHKNLRDAKDKQKGLIELTIVSLDDFSDLVIEIPTREWVYQRQTKICYTKSTHYGL